MGGNIALRAFWPDVAQAKDEMIDKAVEKLSPPTTDTAENEGLGNTPVGHVTQQVFQDQIEEDFSQFLDQKMVEAHKWARQEWGEPTAPPSPQSLRVEGDLGPTPTPLVNQTAKAEEASHQLNRSGINMSTYNSKETLDQPSTTLAMKSIQPRTKIGLDPRAEKLARLDSKLTAAGIDMGTYNSKQTLDQPSTILAYTEVTPAKLSTSQKHQVSQTIQKEKVIQEEKAKRQAEAEASGIPAPTQTIQEKADEAYSTPVLAYYSLLRRSRR